MNFFISPDEQLLTLDLYICADVLPLYAVFDTRNPREMDYDKNKNLYHFCKSNQKGEQRIRWPWFSLECKESIHPDVFAFSSTRSAVDRHSAAWLQRLSCGQLCLTPCCENSVLWIAQILSDTCALSDSYLLLTVCYHSSSWRSSPRKTKQQLRSIRMMLAGEGVCLCVRACVVPAYYLLAWQFWK